MGCGLNFFTDRPGHAGTWGLPGLKTYDESI
jgi:hypothetical protein